MLGALAAIAAVALWRGRSDVAARLADVTNPATVSASPSVIAPPVTTALSPTTAIFGSIAPTPTALPEASSEAVRVTAEPSRLNATAIKAAPIVPTHKDASVTASAPVNPSVPSSAVPAGYDPEQTSWESPFDPDCWTGNGWEFNSAGMRSSQAGGNALFRRGYRRLMLECRLTPLGESKGPLQVRLLTPSTGSALLVQIDGAQLTLLDEEQTPPRVVKQAKIDPPCTNATPGRLRVAATGNRVIVAWNGRIAMSCNQPAAQSGHSAQFEFLVAKTPFEVTALRVEGE